MNNIEVLSPAGDKERLLAAIEYGSDAVYLGRKNFGMRASPSNFDFEGLKEAVELAHKNNVKVYLTCNTLPRNNEIPEFQQFVEEAVECKVDALIAADIGILSLIKKYAPNIEVHASTQTGIVNYVTANELYNMGCKRVVLARELSLEEIAEIRAKTPKQMDIEAFVHGAMCVSFSGRCLLSSYLVNRDANRGECAQPCRWGYHLMEEKRTEDFFPVFEDEQGTYILNSKDLCMINHIDKVIEAGVSSLKIEGRAKSAYYVSIITNAYKMAVEHYKKNTNNFSLPTWINEEVYKVSHRKYCTGFFFGHPNDSQYYETGGYIRGYDVVGVVDKCENGYIYATQRNKFLKGATLEIISSKQQPKKIIATEIFNEKGETVESANHAMMKFSIPSQEKFPQNAIIRMEK